MRIAILSWESLHSISVGGLAVHVTELAASMERIGHEVHVFTRMGHNQQYYELIDGVHYHRCPFETHPDFIEEVNNMCQSFVYHVFQTEDFIGPFDVIHAHDWLTVNAMACIKQERGRKTLLTIHSTEYGRCGNNFYGGASALIRQIERAGTYWADRVITVSHALNKEAMWMYEVPDWKTSVIYNGVNANPFDVWIDAGEIKSWYGIAPMDPMVMFAARMVQQKGPDLLVEAIPSILGYYPNAKFVFAGEGDMRSAVERRADELSVSHATRFLGFKTGRELIDLYKACDVVCVPSRNEPFGIVVLEAWSAEKPVVATKNGGTDEYIWHEVNGLKIDPTPDSIAWGLGTLCNNFEWARWMGHNGKITVEAAFNWEVVAERTLSIYDL